MQAYKNPKHYFHTVDQRQGQISPLNIYPSVSPWNLVQHANPANKKKLNKLAFLGHLCGLIDLLEPASAAGGGGLRKREGTVDQKWPLNQLQMLYKFSPKSLCSNLSCL